MQVITRQSPSPFVQNILQFGSRTFIHRTRWKSPQHRRSKATEPLLHYQHFRLKFRLRKRKTEFRSRDSNGVEDDRHSRSRSFLDRRNRSVTKRGNEQHVRRIQSTRLAVIQDVRSSVTWAAGSSRFALINTALICSFDLPFHPSLAVFSMNLPSSRSPPIGRLFVEFGIASAALPSRFHAWERSLQRGPS